MFRKLFLTLIAFLCLAGMPAVVPAQQPAPQKATDTKAQTVYITQTGKKYLRDGCRYLRNSRIPVSLKDAQAKGFTPCSVCRPPQ
jgi:competence protein ComEC